MSSNIQPFSIAVPESELSRLRQKLALTQLPPTEIYDGAGDGWEHGVPLAEMAALVRHWETAFDWRAVERSLNAALSPQFTADVPVDGFGTLNVHFVHRRSTLPNAIPLLFVHGWPGSFVEVSKILDGLVQGGKWKGDGKWEAHGEAEPVFHVVAPSLVNFGFSEGVTKKGFTIKQHAEVCDKLMHMLGYDQYVGQGGDIGYAVLRYLSAMYPKSCVATHLNFAVLAEPTLARHPTLFAKMQVTPLTDREKAGLARCQWFRKAGYGYNALQSTKPHTIGFSMADSPAGLLAWVYEKLHDWTDSYPWTPDEICTWASIYLFSRAGPAASQRIYYESSHAENWSATTAYIASAKIGMSRFPKELLPFPKLWHEQLGPIVFDREHDNGGHFAAWERPGAIVEDLRTMFGKGGGAEGVVKGKSGYANGTSGGVSSGGGEAQAKI